MSKDTWNAVDGHAVDVDDVVDAAVAAFREEALQGVTVSGGEPFEQPEALLALLVAIRHALPEADCLVYSGLTYEHLERQYADVLAEIDALMSDPFVGARPTEAAWRGSANQRLTLLTDTGRERFADAQQEVNAPRLQVGSDDAGLWITGIPRRGDLERLESQLAERGLVLQDVSWRS